MIKRIFIFLIYLHLSHSATIGEKSSKQLFPFPFLSIVKIPNLPCTPELPDMHGTCFTNKQCNNARGIASGPCAQGFGVCCVVTATCEGTVTLNNTNVITPSNPEPYAPTELSLCNVRIQRPGQNICQVRLDFVRLNMVGPNSETGQCERDRVSIIGVPGSGALPNLCGDLTGQHMYFDYGSTDRITLSLISDGSADQSQRDWNIKVSYIECNSIVRAPDGCTQFYYEATGQVKMLGYPSKPHLADLDYTICVRSEDGAGSIAWSHCQGIPPDEAFFMTGATGLVGGTAADFPAMCTRDYILIMTDSIMDMPTDDRYCGNALGSGMMDTTMGNGPFQVKSTAKPFIVRVRTDGDEMGDVDATTMDGINPGFCLQFRQEPPRNAG